MKRPLSGRGDDETTSNHSLLHSRAPTRARSARSDDSRRWIWPFTPWGLPNRPTSSNPEGRPSLTTRECSIDEVDVHVVAVLDRRGAHQRPNALSRPAAATDHPTEISRSDRHFETDAIASF